jgi:tRNA dimethylallyltransferase
MENKPKVIVIAGPTASGKTALSIEVAKKIDGEIVSCDSMQIYKYMDIGTAKVTKEEMEGIKHYLVDFVEPNLRYTVSDFKKDSESAIEEILAKGKTPIVVGGTGLYANSLIYGIEYQDMDFDLDYRNYLMEKAKTEDGLKSLYEEALKIDPKAMEIISSNDKKRIVRVLEIYKSTGKTKTELEELSKANGIKYDFKKFAIDMKRPKLYERINLRVDKMIEEGLIGEVKNLIEKYDTYPTALQAIGYKEVVEYLKGDLTKEEMTQKIKQETRHYAKRQLTWFRKNNDYIWLDAENGTQNNAEIILKELNEGAKKDI